MANFISKPSFLDHKISFPFSSQIKTLFTSLLKNGDEARIVGGAVRDFLAGKKITDITDIDLACKYPPAKTIALLQARQIKTIESGIKYGTITALIDGQQFQITTLRKDIKNFGRDCEVEFIDDYFEDAQRRDFTINALSIDSQGQLYDYFGGAADLKNQIVKFIGNAAERIEEDYLRILRFFRFSCYYASSLDQEGLLACIKYQKHLDDLSAERVRTEFFKILECQNRINLFAILQKMNEVGILELIIGNLDNQKLDGLKNLFVLEKILNQQFRSLILLAVICDQSNLKLNLTNAEKKYLQSVQGSQLVVDFKIQKKDLLKLLLEFNHQELTEIFIIKLVLNNNFQNLIDDFLRLSKMIASSQIPQFPINGYDLLDLKIKPQEIGKTLKIAQNYWWENDFSVDKQQILFFIKNNRA
ncbi:MAG: CCA tRNA nucleotidyltransferase [Pseudomonadota bacterium]